MPDNDLICRVAVAGGHYFEFVWAANNGGGKWLMMGPGNGKGQVRHNVDLGPGYGVDKGKQANKQLEAKGFATGSPLKWAEG